MREDVTRRALWRQPFLPWGRRSPGFDRYSYQRAAGATTCCALPLNALLSENTSHAHGSCLPRRDAWL